MKSIYSFFCLSLFAVSAFAADGNELTLGQELRACAHDSELLRQKIAENRDAITFSLAPDVSDWKEGSGEKTLNVATPGSLKELLGEELTTVESLTLTGTLNDDDVTTLWEASLHGKLAVIDMAAAHVENNRIADDAFWHFDDQIIDDTGSGFVGIWAPRLKSIKFPESLVELGEDAFAYCYALEEITLPATLREIGEGCFYDCRKLSNPSLNIPEGITAIHPQTFFGCEKLTGKVTFPSSLRKIDLAAFYGTKFTEINFSEGLEEIGMIAFCGCRTKSIVFPASLKKLGYDCCSSWFEIEKVYCAATVPPVCEGDVFSEGLHSTVLYVPAGTASLYAEAPGWDFFQTIVDTEPIPEASLNELFKSERAADSRIFDLNGVEVSEPVNGKFYVKGGKVVKF